jgi:hypothetical protein
MCNACALMCCGSDQLSACGCDCPDADCWPRCELCDEQLWPGDECDCDADELDIFDEEEIGG